VAVQDDSYTMRESNQCKGIQVCSSIAAILDANAEKLMLCNIHQKSHAFDMASQYL